MKPQLSDWSSPSRGSENLGFRVGTCHGLFLCSFYLSMDIQRMKFCSGNYGHTRRDDFNAWKGRFNALKEPSVTTAIEVFLSWHPAPSLAPIGGTSSLSNAPSQATAFSSLPTSLPPRSRSESSPAPGKSNGHVLHFFQGCQASTLKFGPGQQPLQGLPTDPATILSSPFSTRCRWPCRCHTWTYLFPC